MMAELPLFPLNTVLFPGMLLPLHIFEEQYKLLFGDCLESKEPFGVVLDRSREGAQDSARPCDVGTTAQIIEAARLEDGCLNIVALGRQRFRVRRMLRYEPYLVGDVEFCPWRGGDSRDVRERARRVHLLFVAYIDLLKKAAGIELHLDAVPTNPSSLAILAAIVLQTTTEEKQRLLEIPSYGQLLSQEEAFLRREKALLTYMLKTQKPEEQGWPFLPRFAPN